MTLTHYIADVGKGVSMKNLSLKEAQEILRGMKVDIPIPRSAETQIKRNIALDMAVKALNCSETPNSSDSIGRQAAIDALLEKGQASRRYKIGQIWELNFDEIREAIASVPSSQPEIIHCRDCKKYGTKFCAMDTWTDQVTIRRAKPDDFCSMAERKTDECTN